MIVIEFKGGVRNGQAVATRLATITFGRSDNNRVVFSSDDHIGVSRNHAIIRFDGNSYVIEDLQSQGGTYVNGRRVETVQELCPNDVVTLGNQAGAQFQVHFQAGSLEGRQGSGPGTPVIWWGCLALVLVGLMSFAIAILGYIIFF